MSEAHVHTPKRWFDEPSGDALDARIGRLLLDAPAPEALTDAELARVYTRLHAREARSARGPLRYAAPFAVGLLAGSAFAVTSYGVQRLMTATSPAPTAISAPVSAAPAPPKRGSSAPAAVEPVERPEPPKVTSGTSTPEPSSGALGREAELLARALAALRRQGDASGALYLLDEHAREFPHGALRLEADVARVDALLALGRNSEALQMLEVLPIDRLGRGAELRVVRGELRAQRDATRALADFDQALASRPSSELEERALFGRAASRFRTGNDAGARSDLTAYLAKYPSGRFAAEARKRLETP